MLSAGYLLLNLPKSHFKIIDVQGEGTEAAAATIVEIRETTAGGGSPPVFRVDRPFLYVIKKNSTGAFLFMGKVGMPVYEGSK